MYSLRICHFYEMGDQQYQGNFIETVGALPFRDTAVNKYVKRGR